MRCGDPEPPDRRVFMKNAYPSNTVFILHVFLNDFSEVSRVCHYFLSRPFNHTYLTFDSPCARVDVAVNVPAIGHAREDLLEQVACCTHTHTHRHATPHTQQNIEIRPT